MRRRKNRLLRAFLLFGFLVFWLTALLRVFQTTPVHADDVSDLINGSAAQIQDLQNAGEPAAAATPTPALPTIPQQWADYEASLPVPTPMAGNHYVVQLVNESNVPLLGTANAANQNGAPAVAVEPREGTWVMQAFGAPNNANVLTIDIPPTWENTKCAPGATTCSAVGPRFWARTGCRYDIQHNFAQCETGDCEGAYDCGKQATKVPPLGAAGELPVTVSEWTFNAQFGAGGFTYPDISAVDGVNLNMNIEPIDAHSPCHPKDGGGCQPDPNWLSQENGTQPLVFYSQDLRSANKCIPNFELTAGETKAYIQGSTEDPNGVVACFSNCGKYALNPAPADDCDPTDHTSKCYRWKVFCCSQGAAYDQVCINNVGRPDDTLCNQPPPPPGPTPMPPATPVPYPHGSFHGACWYRGIPADPNPTYRCSCRAFIKAPDCAGTVCTNPFVEQPGAQPPFGSCSSVVGSADAACIGDDVLHSVMPRAYTWPNDPQTYAVDAHVYRIVFAPGGSSVPITPAGPIPACSTLPSGYHYSDEVQQCKGDLDKGALFAGAVPAPSCKQTSDCPIIPGSNPPTRYGCNTSLNRCATWACNLADGVAAPANGVVCSWFSPTATPTATPSATTTATPTHTATPSGTPTATSSGSPTATATGTGSPTPTPTGSISPTPTMTASATPTSAPTGVPTPTLTATPTVTPTPATTVFSGTLVPLRGKPGDQVTTTFVATNNTKVNETIDSVTVALSNPKLFSALTLSANGQEGQGNAMPPAGANGFKFVPQITLPSGASLTFTLTGTIRGKNQAMLSPSIWSGGIAYAQTAGTGPAESGTVPWTLLAMIAVVATFAVTLRSRRWMLAGGALILVVAVVGCSGGSSGSSTASGPTSTMTITDANTVGPISGLPLDVAKVKRD